MPTMPSEPSRPTRATGHAQTSGPSEASGASQALDSAETSGAAQASGPAETSGAAQVSGPAEASEPTRVSAAARDAHRARGMAESFGIDVERYDRARPPYPESLIAWIVADSPGTDLLNLGCGTGIDARQFQAAGCTVLGVEPDQRMAEYARCHGLDVEVATFEEWEPAGRTYDAVAAGQAWHWVDPVAGAAKAARVLRPGGRFAAYWHEFVAPDPVQESFAAAYERVVPDAPFDVRAAARTGAYDAMLDLAAGGLAEAGGYAEPERWHEVWERPYTREEWLELLPTTGGLTRLRPDQLDPILDAVGSAVDALGGSFTMRFTTVAIGASRTGNPVP